MMENAKSKKTYKKLIAGICVIVVLIIALTIVSLAWTSLSVKVEKNTFTTGDVSIELTPAGSIIDKQFFEPGATLKGDFQIKNAGDVDAYVKVYLTDVTEEDSLAEYIDVCLYDVRDTNKPILLTTCRADKMKRGDMGYLDIVLEPGEELPLCMTFHMDENVGNEAQGRAFDFTLSCDAVQARNYK